MLTYLFIAISAIFSFLAFSNQSLFDNLKFNPYIILNRKQWYRFFSYSVIHADWMHLMINMFVLYSFGGIVERYFVNYFDSKGYLYFGLLYIGSVFMSVVPSFEKHKKNAYYNAVGASGAVSAVVFSNIIFNPMGKIGFMFLPFAMPSFVFGLLYLVYSAYMSRKGTDNIGHDAHFFGALFGMMFTIAVKPALFMSFIYQIRAYFN